MSGKTLYDKLWDSHVVREQDDGTCLIYIDRHLVHEVTSPQAFEGLRLAGRKPWRTSANLATPDHNVPTTDRDKGIEDPVSRLQVETLDQNCSEFGITEFKMDDVRQGIVHVIGPEQGATLPGMTVVCGDSHTSTHGAFGALAFGIGTSEVEHVLATQCLIQKKSKNMLVSIDGEVSPGVTAKDVVLAIIGEIGTAGGTGYAIEFGGSGIQALSVEGRMTVCNMAIEAGARAGMVAADDKTIEFVKGRPYAPKADMWQQAVTAWRDLKSDSNAVFDREVHIDGASIKPQVTWGTSPEMVVAVDGTVPDPAYQTREEHQKQPHSDHPVFHYPGTFVRRCRGGAWQRTRGTAWLFPEQVAGGQHRHLWHHLSTDHLLFCTVIVFHPHPGVDQGACPRPKIRTKSRK